MHVHTAFSRDAVNTPRMMIKRIKKLGLDGIAIVDHDTLEGYRRFGKHLKKANVIVIPGIEIKTKLGEIGAFFIEEEIKEKSPEGILEEIKDQGAISFLPHPTSVRRGFKKLELAKKVDLIEVFNSRNIFPFENERAKKLAKSLGKGVTAGSDAHFPWEIGRAYVEVEDLEDLRKGKVRIFGKLTPCLVHLLSPGVKICTSLGIKQNLLRLNSY